MAFRIEPRKAVQDFLEAILPQAYQTGLYREPAKFYDKGHSLLVHGMNVLLTGDMLIEYLSDQHPNVASYFRKHRQEVWLTLFLHDILKEKKGVDQLDITPNDIEEWCKRLDVEIDTQTAMRVSARIAIHERSGYPVQGGLLQIVEDDLGQIVIQMADRLGSMRDINEHRVKDNWGLPGIVSLFEGRNWGGRRYKGLNERMKELTGNDTQYQLIAHCHTRTQHALLTSLLLSSTTEILSGECQLYPLNVFYNGVVYIGTTEQCQLVQRPEVTKSVGKTIINRLFGEENEVDEHQERNQWPLLRQMIANAPMDTDSVSVKTKKVSSPLNLLDTPLLGEAGFLGSVQMYSNKRLSSKDLDRKKPKDRRKKVEDIFNGVTDLLQDLEKYYNLALYSEDFTKKTQRYKRMPPMRYRNGEIVDLKSIIETTLEKFDIEAMIESATDSHDAFGRTMSFRQFFDTLADACIDLDWDKYLDATWAKYCQIYRPVVEILLNQGVAIGQTLIKCDINPKIKQTDQFCPSCGLQVRKSGGAMLRAKQREISVPIKIKNHTNNVGGANNAGERHYCYACFMELSLRGLNYPAEVFKLDDDRGKQPFLYLHLLPSFSFPMNWLDAFQVHPYLKKGNVRLQINNLVIGKIFDAIFSEDENRNWRWINSLTMPMRMLKEALFSDTVDNRDEFVTLPAMQVSNAVLLPYYARPNEVKPSGSGLEDPIGRKELWLRGLTWATILAQTLPVRVIMTESPLLNIDPYQIRHSITLVSPPGVIGRLVGRVQKSSYENETNVELTALPDLLKLLVFAIQTNWMLHGRNRTRRVVELLNDLAADGLVGAFYHQRQAQSPQNFSWTDEDYIKFTQACLEVDKMLNKTEVNRIQKLVDITQKFFSPYPWDSSHALTLPFKVVTKTLQKLVGTGTTTPEIKTIARSDLESAMQRQAGSNSTAWIILRDKEIPFQKRKQILTDTVAEFVDVFFEDIVTGICEDVDDFLHLRKRLQSGYLILMKDAGYKRWQDKKATQESTSTEVSN